MKISTIAGVSILALGLVLGIALPGLAASDSAPLQASDIPTEVLRGKVVSIDKGQESFIIQSGEQNPSISVNNDTRYFKLYVPGRLVALVRHRMQLKQPEVQIDSAINQMSQLKKRAMDMLKQQPNLKQLRFLGEKATFGDIAVGTHVALRAVGGENSYLAKTVVIMKPTTYARVSGTVFNINKAAMQITISPLSSPSAEDGDVTLTYNSHTIFVLCGTPGLQEGEKVVAIYVERDDGTLLAKRVRLGVEPFELA
ncbi:MAG TPA: hypothetical protein G4N93_04850 [Dehalococcoidia bacterium]|nr:hypothetical protein [Dehalococcoidia bacterium]